MQKKIVAVFLNSALIIPATAANAADNGDTYITMRAGYSEADIGESDIAYYDDGSITSYDIDDEDTAIGLEFGYYLNNNFSLSAGFRDLGEFRINADSDGNGFFYEPGPVTLAADLDGFTLGVNARLPIHSRFELTGTFGLFFWDSAVSLKDSAGTIFDVDKSENDPFFGVGGTFSLTEKVALGAEFMRFDIDGQDVDAISATLTYSFAPTRSFRSRYHSNRRTAPQEKPRPHASSELAEPVTPRRRSEQQGNMTRAAEEYEQQR